MGGGGKIGKNGRNLAKHCMNLKDLGQFSLSWKNIFPKSLIEGGRNKLKCLEKNPNFGNYPPTHTHTHTHTHTQTHTITVRRVEINTHKENVP